MLTDEELSILKKMLLIIDTITSICPEYYTKDENKEYFEKTGYTIQEWHRSFNMDGLIGNSNAMEILLNSNSIIIDKMLIFKHPNSEKRIIYSLGFELLWLKYYANKDIPNAFLIDLIKKYNK